MRREGFCIEEEIPELETWKVRRKFLERSRKGSWKAGGNSNSFGGLEQVWPVEGIDRNSLNWDMKLGRGHEVRSESLMGQVTGRKTRFGDFILGDGGI